MKSQVLIVSYVLGFCYCGTLDGFYGHLAEVTAPMVHNLVAAGSQQCEHLKRFFGITYDQMQSRNAPPNVEKHLTLDFITKKATIKVNVTTAVDEILESKFFQSSQKTVILIPGFMENSEGMMVKTIAKAFLDKGGYNILALDGSELVKNLYFQSTTNIRYMGIKLGQILHGMVQKDISPESVMIVGHSLGAHISGIAGKEFHRLSGVRIGRITGLDPAGPCFTTEDIVRLEKGDADYVDVIHTDAGVLGLKEAIGNKDFYPNGGSYQPGCPLIPGCGHSRAWEYFAESVENPEAFIARKCRDWQHFKDDNCAQKAVKMGLESKEGADGVYFLTTPYNPQTFGFGLVIS